MISTVKFIIVVSVIVPLTMFLLMWLLSKKFCHWCGEIDYTRRMNVFAGYPDSDDDWFMCRECHSKHSL